MAPMPRPLWTGAISFGLVSIPVKLYNAVSRKSVSFNQLDDRTMARIRYKKVSADDGEEVPDEHIVKGYEFTKGQYVVVEPDELEPFMPVATHTIDLDEFVDLAEIDPIFYDSAYYLAPDKVDQAVRPAGEGDGGGRQGGDRPLRDAQQAVRRPPSAPVDGRLVLSTMVYADEVVNPAKIDELEGLEDVEVTDQGADDGRAARRVAGRAVRAGEVPRRVPRAGARPDRQEGRRRGARGARAGGDRAEGRRPHGRARGEREGGQGQPHPPPHGARADGEGREGAGRRGGRGGAGAHAAAASRREPPA